MFLWSDDILRDQEKFDPEEDSDWELDCDPDLESQATKDVEPLPVTTQKPPLKENAPSTAVAADKPTREENVPDEVSNALPADAYEPPPEENATEVPNALPADAYKPPPEDNAAEAVNADRAREPSTKDDPYQSKKPQKRRQEDDEIPPKKVQRTKNEQKVKLIQEPMYVSLYHEAVTRKENGRITKKPMWMTNYVVKRKKKQSKSKKQ